MGKGKSKGKGKFGGWYQQGKGTGLGGSGMGSGTPKGFPKGALEAKGKGKMTSKVGAKGDEKGKGKGKGICYKCGHPGHVSKDCLGPRPFQGYCSLCGNWGHTAKFCQAGRIQEIGQEQEEPDQEVDHSQIVNELGIGGLYIGGNVDSVEAGWHTANRRGKTVKRTCMRSVCAIDRRASSNTGADKSAEAYEKIRITADSGAVDHVAPRSTAAHIPIRETAASRQGVHYVAANGSKISNMGAKRIRGFTKERTPLDMTWQIAEVKRPLASIGKICDAGNTAIFTDRGGFIVPSENLKGLIGRLEATDQPVLRMNREHGVYSFDM